MGLQALERMNRLEECSRASQLSLQIGSAIEDAKAVIKFRPISLDLLISMAVCKTTEMGPTPFLTRPKFQEGPFLNIHIRRLKVKQILVAHFDEWSSDRRQVLQRCRP